MLRNADWSSLSFDISSEGGNDSIRVLENSKNMLVNISNSDNGIIVWILSVVDTVSKSSKHNF